MIEWIIAYFLGQDWFKAFMACRHLLLYAWSNISGKDFRLQSCKEDGIMFAIQGKCIFSTEWWREEATSTSKGWVREQQSLFHLNPDEYKVK